MKFIILSIYLFLCGFYSFIQPVYSKKSDDTIIIDNTSNDSLVKRIDFLLKTRDGIKLDCTKFVPPADSNMPSTGFPVLILCHGYADSKSTELDYAYAQAQYGYYTFAYSMRGQGKSGGFSNLISRTEMNDFIDVVKYIKSDTASHIDTNLIGVSGSSQGGIIPYMAVCNGLNLNCVMSDLATPDFASNWIENGCVKTTLFFSVDYDSATVRYDAAVKRLRLLILAKDYRKWDSLKILLPKDRNFDTLVGNCQSPMLITNAWQDKFFDASGTINSIDRLTTPFRIYIGAIDGHGADSTSNENNYLTDLQNSWIDYWLNGIDNKVLDSAKYNYASSHFPLFLDKWSFTHYKSDSWPPDTVIYRKIYFNNNNKISYLKSSSSRDSVTLVNDVKDTSASVLNLINSSFTGTYFDSLFSKKEIIFDSDPLQTTFVMVGVPKLYLNYSSDAGICQYNLQIWEVNPNGKVHLVTRINYTDRHNLANKSRQAIIEGQAHSHIFLKGYKIRIKFTNLDTDPYDTFLKTNPYVLPSMERANNVMYIGNEDSTWLELPVRVIPTDITEQSSSVSNPLGIQLFPNPATDQTLFVFDNPANQNINIEIFNSLGQSVKKLLIEYLTEGSQSKILNLNNLNSGIYFLKVSGNNFTEFKKFVIVK